MNSVQKTLVKARDLIKKFGWVQFEDGSRNKGFCAMKATEVVTWSFAAASRAQIALNEAAPGGSMLNYNDAPRRTKGEVIAAFNKAIKNAGKKKKV